ncbi:hypothetical protein AGLY_011453 [Aphis glycines]|uniref:Uncharacterized protein n=1 Tax=Aphis glycines TaxID=307491 RepID=A0A6G0TBJ8_APHGL|nr:hypothetical protein AGLY_011453 [Aphis glycines]
MGIFTQNQFSTESIFLYGCNSKTKHCKYLKFSPNVYTTEIFDFYVKFFFEVSFKFLRNLSKTRKFAMRLNFKFLRNRVTIKIYPQTILNICYYSKSISRRYLKILPTTEIFNFSENFWPNQNTLKFYTKFLICYSYTFEVQILTKIRQNHEYLQIIKIHKITDKSSPFRIVFRIQWYLSLHSNLIYPSPRSTPPSNIQQSGTHLPNFFLFIKLHFPTVFKKKIEKNKKKNDRKTGIFTLNQFSTTSIFL